MADKKIDEPDIKIRDDDPTELAMESARKEKQDLKTKIVSIDVDKVATLEEVKVVLKDILQAINKLM